MPIDVRIESILFSQGSGVSLGDLSRLLDASEDEILQGITTLKDKLEGRGVCVVQKDNAVTLATVPEVSELMEKIRKEELSKDLGKAGLETLSIVLYRSPVARSEIDYLRGVNSSSILRSLSVRGLVERISNESDNRGYLYRPTMELLAHLGVSSIEGLPEYTHVREEMTSTQEVASEHDEPTHEDLKERPTNQNETV